MGEAGEDATWRDLIEHKQTQPCEPSVSAETFVKRHKSWAQPITVLADDGGAYVVKACQADRPEVTGRAVTTDHVAARLARHLNAPVPHVTYVHVSQEFIDANPEIHDYVAGPAHGLQLVANCSDRVRVTKPDTERNRDAHGRLAVLYGWLHADDVQLICTLDRERDVYSVDHGGFLPSGPNWSAESLRERVTVTSEPFPRLANGANPWVIDETVQLLKAIDDHALAAAIGWARLEWGVPVEDLSELARFLSGRRDAFVWETSTDA